MTYTLPTVSKMKHLLASLMALIPLLAQHNTGGLERGGVVKGELTGDQVQTSVLPLSAGQYLRLILDQPLGDPDADARLYGPDGTLVAVATPMVALQALIQRTGAYRVEVRAHEKQAAGLRYRLRVDELRRVADQDDGRVAASHNMLEANQLHPEGSDETARKRFVEEADETGKRKFEKYREALAEFRTLGDRRGEAEALTNIGLAYWGTLEPARARDYFEQVLPFWQELGDRRREGRVRFWLGSIHSQLGHQQEALSDFQELLALWRALGERDEEANVLKSIAGVYSARNDKQSELDFLNEALAAEHAVGNRPGEAQLLWRLGDFYALVGDPETAIDYYARRVAVGHAMGDRASEPPLLLGIAKRWEEIGDTQKAVDSYQQALAAARAIEHGPWQAAAIGQLSAMALQTNEFQKALDYSNQVLQFWRTQANQHGLEAWALKDVANIYAKMGDREKALEYLRQALDMRAYVQAPATLAFLRQVGAVYQSVGDPRTALSLYQEAFAARGTGPATAVTLDMARAEADLGDLVEARRRVETVLDFLESGRATIIDPELRSYYFQDVRRSYEFYIDLLMRLHAQRPLEDFDGMALQASERARARVLVDLLAEAHADIRRGADTTLLARERSLQEKLNTAARAQARILSGQHPARQAEDAEREIGTIVSDLDQVRTTIRATSPRYAALMQPTALSLREIQQQVLDRDTLLLEYSLGDRRSYGWAVTPDSFASFALAGRAEVEPLARRVYEFATARNRHPKGETDRARRARLQQAQTGYSKASERLSRILFSPVANLLSNRRLIIVCDGALEYVPFAALPESTGQPLIARHEIIRLASASVLAEVRRGLIGRERPPKNVAVLADPVFDPQDPRVLEKRQRARVLPSEGERSAIEAGVAESGTRIPRLHFSRREAEAISSASRTGVMKALDFEASRAMATNPELARYRIIHFATHGVLNNKHPELSGLLLSLVDRHGMPQDGFLRLHEIYNLNLPADMVVLSACQTALGKEIRGEGLVGLARGFMYAGAARVVASLWKVDDAATAELMARFYRAMLTDRLSPPEALRAAQIQIRRQSRWQETYYWASFELQGEWK